MQYYLLGLHVAQLYGVGVEYGARVPRLRLQLVAGTLLHQGRRTLCNYTIQTYDTTLKVLLKSEVRHYPLV